MGKTLKFTANIQFTPRGTAPANTVLDITNREEALNEILEEIKRRIEKEVPINSDCSITIGHSISHTTFNVIACPEKV